MNPGEKNLPKHLRFARMVALVSGGALGVAAGGSMAGCVGKSCSGPCGDFDYRDPIDAAGKDDARPVMGVFVIGVSDVPIEIGPDAGVADAAADASSDAATGSDASDADATHRPVGGPLVAPAFPSAWLA